MGVARRVGRARDAHLHHRVLHDAHSCIAVVLLGCDRPVTTTSTCDSNVEVRAPLALLKSFDTSSRLAPVDLRHAKAQESHVRSVRDLGHFGSHGAVLASRQPHRRRQTRAGEFHILHHPPRSPHRARSRLFSRVGPNFFVRCTKSSRRSAPTLPSIDSADAHHAT